MCRNPYSVQHWQEHSLHYSQHALDRAYTRNLPVINRLPETARLADCEMRGMRVRCIIVKIPKEQSNPVDWFMIINPDGFVITVFPKGSGRYHQWNERRMYYRKYLDLN